LHAEIAYVRYFSLENSIRTGLESSLAYTAVILMPAVAPLLKQRDSMYMLEGSKLVIL